MDKNKRKKSGKRIRPIFKRRSANGGMPGGASRWKPPPFTPRRDYNYKTEQKHFPKEEKSHWNGKVQVWTEPQKPRQEKVIKYEVDTDKLLNELARGNKEALNEIAEKLQETAEDNPEKSDEPDLQKLDSSEKTDKESDIPEAEHDKAEESLEPLDKEIETNKEGEIAEEKSETSEEAKEDLTEPVEHIENPTQENQEMPQDTETEPETNPQEDPLEAPELVYMSPSFWEQLESEMSDELEQLEPEEEIELPPEESEPFSEGY